VVSFSIIQQYSRVQERVTWQGLITPSVRILYSHIAIYFSYDVADTRDRDYEEYRSKEL